MQSSSEKFLAANKAGTYTAVPADPMHGGGDVFDDDTGTRRANTIEEAYLSPPISFGNRDHPNGPIVGIGIAADSPIATVDAWLGDISVKSRVRIGVGRPYFGDLSQIDRADLTLVRAMPDIALNFRAIGETTDQWIQRNRVFDSTFLANPSTGAGRSSFGGFITPVRLELYRGTGQFPVPTRRADYPADFGFALKTQTYARYWIITDGRSNVDVSVCLTINGVDYTSPTNSATVEVRAHNPVFDMVAPTSRFMASLLLDTQVIGGVVDQIQHPTYVNSFCWPAMMYSVTIINGDPVAGNGHGILGSCSIVARD